jgi:Transposase
VGRASAKPQGVSHVWRADSTSSTPPQVYCGIDLHARSLYVCLLNQDGDIVVHRQLPTTPAAWLKTMAPSREPMVSAVACLVTWAWLADLCAQAGMPCVLGPALSMTAIHGGNAKHDTIDAHKIAVLLRGGLWPQADVSPAAMRAPRDLRRRRIPLRRQRAERLTHVQQPHGQYHLPDIGQKIADQANRAGVAERLPAPAVPKSLEVALALIDDEDQRLRDLRVSSI